VADRSGWFTITGPHAFCEGCAWGMNGDNNAKRLASAARFHAKDTGHRVRIERGQARYIAHVTREDDRG